MFLRRCGLESRPVVPKHDQSCLLLMAKKRGQPALEPVRNRQRVQPRPPSPPRTPGSQGSPSAAAIATPTGAQFNSAATISPSHSAAPAARSPCESRVGTVSRASAARQASSRRRVSRYPAAHWTPRRHWHCCHRSRRAVCRRLSRRRGMACGETSVCPAASLGRRVIGRPSRCALSAGACPVLVPRLISAAPAAVRASARRWLAGATPLVSVRLDASSGVLEPWSLATVCVTSDSRSLFLLGYTRF